MVIDQQNTFTHNYPVAIVRLGRSKEGLELYRLWYARVNTDRQENKNQLEQLREFAKKQDWDIVREFVDTVSGSGKAGRHLTR